MKVRNGKGNVLIMTCMTMALGAVGMLIAMSFGGLCFVNNRLQSSADEIALTGARKLNEGDRLGQMNNFVARARQLVFTSRQSFSKVESGASNPLMLKLAREILDESKDGALSLDQERQRLQKMSRDEALQAMDAKFNEVKSSYAMTLPWLKVSAPTVLSLNCGKIKDVDTNVSELKNLDELTQQDQPNIRKSAALNLYKEGDIKLPGLDRGIPFKMSSLIAPSDRCAQPARNCLANSFTDQPNYSGSATQVFVTVDVTTGLGPSASGKITVIGTAAATGGNVFK